MATIKLYTDIEQSKKLAEILPLESADMFYHYNVGVKSYYEDTPRVIQVNNHFAFFHRDIPCWSLAALLGILAEQDFIIKSLERNNEYQYNIDIPSRHCKIWFSSLLDAAFEMVCYLKENNKL